MQIVLLERVKNLGHLGDVVNVKPGFARNYLVPYGKAVPATKDNIEQFEQRRAELEEKARKLHDEAQKRAEQLQDFVLDIHKKASEEGRLYGSVAEADIAKAIQNQGITVNKKEVQLGEGPIRQTGDYTVKLHFHSDVIVDLPVSIKAE